MQCIHDYRKNVKCDICGKQYDICSECLTSHLEYHKVSAVKLSVKQKQIMDSLDMGTIYQGKRYDGIKDIPHVVKKKEEYFAERGMLGNEFYSLKDIVNHSIMLHRMVNRIRSKKERQVLR